FAGLTVVLDADVAFCVGRIVVIGRKDVVDPDPEPVTFGLDAIPVPLAVPEGFPGLHTECGDGYGVFTNGIEPAAAPLVIEPAGPLPVGGVDLGLVAVDPVG